LAGVFLLGVILLKHVLLGAVVFVLVAQGGQAARADGLGGCCRFDGSCLNEVTEAECIADSDLNFWLKDQPCGEAGGFTCHPRIGACCDGATCQSPISILECQCPQCAFTAGGDCAKITCAIPTTSAWGLVIMTLLLLTGAKIRNRE